MSESNILKINTTNKADYKCSPRKTTYTDEPIEFDEKFHKYKRRNSNLNNEIPLLSKIYKGALNKLKTNSSDSIHSKLEQESTVLLKPNAIGINATHLSCFGLFMGLLANFSNLTQWNTMKYTGMFYPAISCFELFLSMGLCMIIFTISYASIYGKWGEFKQFLIYDYRIMILRSFNCSMLILIPIFIIHVPIGDFKSIGCMSVIWTPVIAYFWLGEQFKYIRIVVIPIVILAVCLITRPSFLFGASEELLKKFPHYSFGIIGATIMSMQQANMIIILRKMKKIPFYVSTLFNGIIFVIVSLVGISLIGYSEWNYTKLSWFVFAGIGSSMQQIVYPLSAQYVPASQMVVLTQLNLIFYYVLDVFVYKIEPYFTAYIGVALIIIGNLVNSFL